MSGKGTFEIMSDARTISLKINQVSNDGFLALSKISLALDEEIKGHIRVNQYEAIEVEAYVAWNSSQGQLGFVFKNHSFAWQRFISHLYKDVFKIKESATSVTPFSSKKAKSKRTG